MNSGNDAIASCRIVIDTNVLVSGIVFGGKPRVILDLIADGAITVITAEELHSEARRIISTKFPDFLADLVKVTGLFEADAEWVRLGLVPVLASRDPDDDKFLEAAVLGGVQYIVSGDKDLLTLGSYQEIPILSPADFLAELFSPKS